MNKNLLYKILITFIFVLGAALRIYAFIPYRALWRDECNLALSIYFHNFADLWGVLEHMQSAPPIFMTVCKIFNSVNPYFPEYFLRLFPLISGLVAIYLFYKLTTKLYESDLAILAANFLFAVNTKLIYFSHEFKQYSSDTAVLLALLLYFMNFDIANMSRKKLVAHSFIIALCPFLSLPSVFVIASWFCLNLIQKANLKRLFLIVLPALVLNLFYYIHTLIPSRKIMLKYFNFLWQNGFLEFNINSVTSIIKNNIHFYFNECMFILIPVCLLFLGLIIMLKRRNKLDKLILYTLGFVILASFMKIYPIDGRVSLYLLPLIIAISVIPLAVCKQNVLKITCIILLMMITGRFNMKDIINTNIEPPSYMMQILKYNYKPGEYIIYNDVSDSQFAIYEHIYDLQVPQDKIGVIQLTDYSESWYYSVLDLLPKNNKYWFYYANDLNSKPVIVLLKNWVNKNGNVLYEKDFNNACLLYVQL